MGIECIEKVQNVEVGFALVFIKPGELRSTPGLLGFKDSGPIQSLGFRDVRSGTFACFHLGFEMRCFEAPESLSARARNTTKFGVLARLVAIGDFKLEPGYSLSIVLARICDKLY